MLTIKIAKNLRKERGLLLPTGGPTSYETIRLRYIAERQHKLMEEFDKLDQELLDMETSSD